MVKIEYVLTNKKIAELMTEAYIYGQQNGWHIDTFINNRLEDLKDKRVS